jgi:hypothetical protein
VEKSEANDYTWPQYVLHGRFSTIAFDLIRVTPSLLIVTVGFREEQRIVFGSLYMCKLASWFLLCFRAVRNFRECGKLFTRMP